MTWTDNISNRKTFKIQSRDENGVTDEIIKLFSEIKGDEFEGSLDILIYIDSTNGNLFISAFNVEIEEVFDEKSIFVELPEFWEENQNSYDFDELIKSALKKAYKKSEKTIFKTKYNVFFQTEDESEAKRL